MAYSALDVAKLIITDGYNRHFPVTNLRLQKLMYFVWIEFYKATGRELFTEPFYAWKLGPVILDVYREFCRFIADPIFKKYSVEITDEDAEIIQNTVQKYDEYSTASLVKITHRDGSPWSNVFLDGSGYNKEITYDEIIRLECKAS